MASGSSRTVGRVLLTVGIVIGALAIASVGVLFWFFSLPIDYGYLSDEQTIRGGLLLTEDTVSEGGIVMAIPAGIALVAMCFLFPGYFLSRGQMGRSSGDRSRGSISARFTLLSTRASLRWIGVAVLGWIVILVLPLASGIHGGWPLRIEADARIYIYSIAGMYGAISAGIAFLLAVSLVKKRRQLHLVAAGDPRLKTDDPARGFWRWYCYRWRIDSWLAFLGGASVGVSALTLLGGGILVFAALILGGCAFVGVAIATSRQFWRSGEALGSAEGAL